MPKKPIKPVKQPEVPAKVVTPEVKVPGSNGTVLTVLIRNTQPDGGPLSGTKREFSLARHGVKFAEIAEQFKTRFNGEYVENELK